MTDKQKEQVAELTAQLEDGVAAIFADGCKFSEFLQFAIRFPRYSWRNIILIMRQCPHASRVAGFKAWKDAGRSVAKGAKSIKILAPCTYRKTRTDENGAAICDENGNPQTYMALVGFKVAHVFDISQTVNAEGEADFAELAGFSPISDGDFSELLAALTEAAPCPVEFSRLQAGHYGLYSPAKKSITINSDYSSAEQASTLAHETAHAILHDNDNGTEKGVGVELREMEAEAVAYIVGGYFGLDSSGFSFRYIANWSETKEIKELQDVLSIIQKTAGQRRQPSRSRRGTAASRLSSASWASTLRATVTGRS